MDSDAGMSADMPGCDSMKLSPVDKTKAKGVFYKVTAQCQFGSMYHLFTRLTSSDRPRSLGRPLFTTGLAPA